MPTTAVLGLMKAKEPPSHDAGAWMVPGGSHAHLVASGASRQLLATPIGGPMQVTMAPPLGDDAVARVDRLHLARRTSSRNTTSTCSHATPRPARHAVPASTRDRARCRASTSRSRDRRRRRSQAASAGSTIFSSSPGRCIRPAQIADVAVATPVPAPLGLLRFPPRTAAPAARQTSLIIML